MGGGQYHSPLPAHPVRVEIRLTLRRLIPPLYCLWAAVAIGLSLALAGLNAESVTRLLVLGFLALQLLARRRLIAAVPGLTPRTRFILLGTLLAAVVEGFHMISMPVLPTLRVGWETPPSQAALNYGIDLLLTVPAYLVIFAVLWSFVTRYRYERWEYAIVMGLAQALGDGGIYFFAAAPAMLAFLPYPMTNYHAVNVIPFLATEDALPPDRVRSARAWLVIPVVIAVYFVCGAAIKLVAGRL